MAFGPDNTARRRGAKSVYVIGPIGGPVKIGVAVDVEKRLAALQSSFPVTLRVYHSTRVEADARKVEKHAHAALRAHRLRGEWFEVAPDEAISVISKLLAASETLPAWGGWRRSSAARQVPVPIRQILREGARLDDRQIRISSLWRMVSERARANQFPSQSRPGRGPLHGIALRRAEEAIRGSYGDEMLVFARAVVCDGMSPSDLNIPSGAMEKMGPLLTMIGPLLA